MMRILHHCVGVRMTSIGCTYTLNTIEGYHTRVRQGYVHLDFTQERKTREGFSIISWLLSMKFNELIILVFYLNLSTLKIFLKKNPTKHNIRFDLIDSF